MLRGVVVGLRVIGIVAIIAGAALAWWYGPPIPEPAFFNPIGTAIIGAVFLVALVPGALVFTLAGWINERFKRR